ncbi:M20/M25/M40 family metallo-hydrolase [Pontibacter silvestris]|uniref:M20/M25/M40 family metallo-hydrolase n=1 Tax=Pontibacter silvestris TaxID=2305183 RepID=A0ABW4WY79_9BACT|nr:M20/M25/M40 family metallo-hydrolase [Pontibacter silvestris]MCC9135170.1 M20/M25/M40 family metallo-hydrolase [Pontibacter silvestris]
MNFKNYTRSLVVILCLTSLTSFGQKISKDEKKILRNVEQSHDEAINFLQETVNVNSGTFNLEGVKQAGTIYKKMLEDMGFTTTWIDMPESMNRAGHLIGEIKGNKGKRLLLIGHIDTVFEPESPFQSWEEKDSIAIGPGSSDMKGGNMVMLYALKALKDAGQLKDRQVIVVLHGDEENAGRPLELSRRDIIDAAKRSEIALGFETGTGFNDATIARRGSSSWTLKVSGKQSHSSGVFSKNTGAGAIYETARILNRFYEELQEEYLTFNPGVILGGTKVTIDSSGTQGTASGKTNLVANTTIVKGDLRFLTEEQKEQAREKMKAILAESLPQTKAEISFTDSYPAMPPTEGNMAVLNVLNQVSLDLGQGEVKPYDPGKRGAGDISFVAQYLDGLDGLGVIGGSSHAPGEYVDLNSLEDITKRTALLLYRLTSSK